MRTVRILVVSAAASFLVLGCCRPRVSTTASYFEQAENARIDRDVSETLELLTPFLDAPPGDFRAYGDFPWLAYKYAIAFTSYALANVAVIEPDLRPRMATWIDGLIQRMLEEEAWGDWRTQGWGTCPLEPSNLMWKGHLNLMYALHLFVSGEDKYEDAFRRLSRIIADEMRRSPYGGAVCQTINYYFQCNTIGMLSLRYHDAFYGTSYGTELEPRWLAWARENMVVRSQAREEHNAIVRTRSAGPAGLPDLSIWPETAVGCYYAVYHPESMAMARQLSGYTNGWIATYLNFFDPEAARRLYHESFKPTFVREFGEWAFAEEQPGKGLDGMATLFAFYAAREHGDRDLMAKILNLLDCAGKITYTSVNPELSGSGPVTIDFPTNVPMQGAFLFGKTNVGIARLYSMARPLAGPGPRSPSRVPEDWRRICPGIEGSAPAPSGEIGH